MSQELQLGKYEFFPYEDDLTIKSNEKEEESNDSSDFDLEELLEKITKRAKQKPSKAN